MRVLLPPILDALRRGGLAPDAVTLLVATGLHRPCTAAELREMLGSELAGSLRIVQHDARDAASHVDLGRTRGGIPILIDRFFLERDLRIVTGLIEPHLMAGYSGGRKARVPGARGGRDGARGPRPGDARGPRRARPRGRQPAPRGAARGACAGSACTFSSTSRSTASAASRASSAGTSSRRTRRACASSRASRWSRSTRRPTW